MRRWPRENALIRVAGILPGTARRPAEVVPQGNHLGGGPAARAVGTARLDPGGAGCPRPTSARRGPFSREADGPGPERAHGGDRQAPGGGGTTCRGGPAAGSATGRRGPASWTGPIRRLRGYGWPPLVFRGPPERRRGWDGYHVD